jgi:hypothetical protein
MLKHSAIRILATAGLTVGAFLAVIAPAGAAVQAHASALSVRAGVVSPDDTGWGN